MVVPRIPVYFQQIIQDRQLTTPVGKMGDHTVLPVKGKLPLVRSQTPCLKTANCHNWAGSTSAGMRSISDGFKEIDKLALKIPMGASSFISLPAGVGVGVGIAGMYDHYKEYKRAEDVQDSEGQRLAVLGGVESGLLATGSTAVLGLKTFSMIQDVGLALHQPVVFSGVAATVQGAFSWASSIVFGIYYVINGIKSGLGLVSWYQGRKWRQELLKAKDPAQVLYKELRSRTNKMDMTAEEEMDLGLKAGARWLDKVEQASGGTLKIKDKKEAFRKLIIKHPEIIRELIGDFGEPLSARGELIRFGKYMAYQNVCAKFEAECARKLGSKAVEAMKSGDTTALTEALQLKEWVGMAIKVGAAVIGLIAIIALAVVLTHSPLGIILILAGIAGLAMVFVSDGQAIKEHLQNGEFKKRDRLFVYFTLALSLISFVGVVALTIATGGIAPFIVALILSGVWLGINSYSGYLLWRYENQPWKVQKVVDLVTYRKFLETAPIDLTPIKSKMTQADQDYVDTLENPLEELKREEQLIEQAHKEELARLIKVLLTR